MKIDAHQHFWVYDAAQYPWIPQDSPLHRDWLPADLEREQVKLGFHGSVAVQARQSIEESHWLLTLADHAPLIKAVVGWVDLRSDRVEEQLAQFAAEPKFAGVRHVVQDEPDDRFLMQPDFLRGIGKLAGFDLAYDLLVRRKQLPAAVELVQQFPRQRFILDHLAKPNVKDGVVSPWREHIEQLAACENVTCKVSGLVTEADHRQWKPADFRPFLDVVFAAFGPARLMFGSDWPVCLLAGSYEQVYSLIADYARPYGEARLDDLFGGNAARIYRIPPAASAAQ